jgi:predicted nucleic acid-binding protein
LILVDTSVRVDHLRASSKALAALLDAGQVLAHPFVIGELALAKLRPRDLILRDLQDLPQASVATDREVLHFIDRNALDGLGIGYIDAHLLTSARLTAGAALWTKDRRLNDVALRLGLAAAPPRV